MADFAPFRKLTPVSHKAVTINDVFWAPRIETLRTATLPYELEQLESTGRIDNLRKAAGIVEGEFQGLFFNDSDVYKWLEAACYSLAHTLDAELQADVDDLVDVIAAAQQPDGYLNSFFTIAEPENRWTSLLHKHELYCAGHLIEAAVAHFETTGKRTLLDVARRLADHIDGIFGLNKRHGAPGHEEIELALVKLYRTTGEERYLDLAQFFIDIRGEKLNPLLIEAENEGNTTFDPECCQAHAPVWEQSKVVGHAVRGMYLYCGTADVFAETGDKDLLAALNRLWENMVARRMYITGGVGSSGSGERFTRDYDLPNDTAYAETCAAIGSVLWNHRMFLLTGEARFADAMELALYNGALAGIGLNGTSFFYVNPLRSIGNHERQGWFTCACCPPNIARLLASIGGYACAQTADSVFVAMYVNGSARIEVGGREIVLRQQTEYPWSGEVTLTVETAEPVEFELLLRIPGWCKDASVAVGNADAEPAAPCDWMSIRRKWSNVDSVRLNLPMPPVVMAADPRVEADFGRVALMRGPLVYCLEEADNGTELFQITLPPTAEVKPKRRSDLLGNVVVLEAMGESPDASDWDGALYRPARGSGAQPRKITAVPYYAWANRTPGEMAVWLNR